MVRDSRKEIVPIKVSRSKIGTQELERYENKKLKEKNENEIDDSSEI